MRPRTWLDLVAEILFYFSGRIDRRTYWLSVCGIWLALAVISLVLFFVDSSILYTQDQSSLELIALPWLWPFMAVHVKRLHDRGRSGWWSGLIFVPPFYIGIFIECAFLPGRVGPNAFGAAPLRVKRPV